MRLPASLLLLTCLACASTREGGPTFEQIQATSISAASARVLGLLTSGQGSLIVFGGPADSLFVRYAVSTQTRAGLFPNQVETIDKGDSLLVAIRPTAGSTIDLQVEMPEKLTVDLYDEEGRQVIFRNIENRVDVFAHEGGSLDFDDVEGPLSIKDGAGPISIHDVRGPIQITDSGGGIVIREVKKGVQLQTGDGDVMIEKVEGDVVLTTGSGELKVRDVSGKVSYKKSGSGPVTIERVAGGVEKL